MLQCVAVRCMCRSCYAVTARDFQGKSSGCFLRGSVLQCVAVWCSTCAEIAAQSQRVPFRGIFPKFSRFEIPLCSLAHAHSRDPFLTHKYIHCLSHARTHARTHVCTHARTHTRTHARTHARTCVRFCAKSRYTLIRNIHFLSQACTYTRTHLCALVRKV